VAQVWLDAAVQPQPAAVVTVTAEEPPLAAGAGCAGTVWRR